MFSHIVVGSNDIEKSKTFYDAILAALDYPAGVIDEKGRCIYANSEGVLIVTPPINGQEATPGNGMTIGFSVSSPEQADAWHQAGIENGGITCEDPPGVRAHSERELYLAYLRDPSGNKLCAVYHIA
ncbi:VOC family protein [Vibrio gazogenes]|uniref:Catechol 2,3-dioxygenase n=1 Tax=Vibrio gazogenes DSM 21264 = NBRC 103151 TaxID=1123492 RepID=A0A1M5EKL3_VIBGA|nr:VOC family protein [Vibrio gazogenes]USP12548.1 VOC family protein [Vibrio gazogenes]SHF79737.1 Catechol 2,3-dioxygenase [Vibrio gazogenes DSM 21264] [Vibrio gazogenes DSM 21264 = NBRC 103151]SJN54029.1 Glyoxalase-like domain protein [Vibrio gazogenes]